MRKRVVLVLGFAAALMGIAGISAGQASAAQTIGKTGVYKDACGMNHVWVNGQDLGPQYLVCIPTE